MCSPHFSSSLDSCASFPRHAVVMFPVPPACWKPLEFSGAPEILAHSKTARNFDLGNALDLRWEQEDCRWNHSEPLKQDPSVGLAKPTHVQGLLSPHVYNSHTEREPLGQNHSCPTWHIMTHYDVDPWGIF